MLPSFCRETVELMRPKAVEARGTVEHASGEYEPAGELAGCCVQMQSQSTKRGEPRTLNVESDATLFAPPGAAIEEGFLAKTSMGEFVVDGVMPRVSPTGAVSHVECSLTAWKG